jgi:hypothetical protein
VIATIAKSGEGVKLGPNERTIRQRVTLCRRATATDTLRIGGTGGDTLLAAQRDLYKTG